MAAGTRAGTCSTRSSRRSSQPAGQRSCRIGLWSSTSAITFLRNRGNVFALQKILGHSDLAMVRRYAELAEGDVTAEHALASPLDLTPEQVVAAHQRLSPLDQLARSVDPGRPEGDHLNADLGRPGDARS